MSNPLSSPRGDHEPPRPAAIRHSRHQEVEEVSRLWTGQRLTLLYGSPGVGKSTLLRAGVIPRLREQGGRLVLPVGRVTHHTAFPLAALPPQNHFTFPLLSSWAPDESPGRLSELSVRQFLSRRLGPDRFGSPARAQLCVDQAELLFRELPGRETQRERFLADLFDALAELPHLRLLLVLRTSQLAEAESFAERLRARGVGTASFRLGSFDRQAALRALAWSDDENAGITESGGDRRAALVDELRTIRTPDGRRIHTESVDPSLLGIVRLRLGTEPEEGPAGLAGEVNRALGEHASQLLAMVAADHRLPRSKVEEWFRDAFVDPTPRHAPEEHPMPAKVLGALEDKRLIKARHDSGGPGYELQHPRLLEALRAPLASQVPMRRPSARGRLGEAAAAFWHRDFPLARAHVEGAVRTCLPRDLETRARAECLLGDLACAEGEFTTAIRRYETAAAMFEALRNTALVGHLLSAVGRLSLRTDPADPMAALRNLHAAATRLPHDSHVQTALGQALWQAGQTQAAFAALNEVLSKDGDNIEALRVRGELHADLGEAESALQDLDRVDCRASTSALSAWALARALRARERQRTEPPPEPDGLGEVVGSAEAGNGPVLLRVALVRELRGDYRDAARFASRALLAQRPPVPPQLLSKAEKLKKGT